MKKLILGLVVISVSSGIFAQIPQKMSYQAVVRNSDGSLVTNQIVGVEISIFYGSPTGLPIWMETCNPKPQTNSNGLLSLEIGESNPLSGVEWSSGGPFFIKTDIDPTGGNNYTITGTSQLLSVPFAFHAKSAENGVAQGNNVGEMLYWNGMDWIILPAGSDGQILSMVSGVPVWGTGSTADDDLQIINISPVDGERVTASTPILNWECIDSDPFPEPKALLFDVYLAGPSGTEQVGTNLITPTVKVTLTEPGDYYWRVYVKDDLGHITISDLWNFQISADYFDQPTSFGIVTPGDGESVSRGSVKLEWVCTDPDGLPLTFDVYLAGPHGTEHVGVNLLTPLVWVEIDEPGDYTWRVYAKDDLGHLTISELWNFTVVQEP